MPALIPVDKIHGALLIATVLSSIIYGVTWSQVYSYYNSHSSRDRWPLRSFVAFLMLVDSANLVFLIYSTYQLIITDFGDYEFTTFTPWSQAGVVVSTVVLEVSVQHFYAYRIYCLSWRSPYLPAAISVISLTEFGIGIVYSTKILKHTHESELGGFPGVYLATLSFKVLCDVLITVGMVYTLLSNRTRVRRTNNMLNILAIYAVNCGILHLVFAISCVILVPFAFTSCVHLSNIDYLNEVHQVPIYAHMHAIPLHNGSTLTLRVHVHVGLVIPFRSP
ncbi:hypothetical protein EDB85DRAFT_150678 [Lactarius pseudohatsudake]|nr:hypothetical protein EDB85DRAFT_150678 [Lactarius pseudohatsudake]